MWIHDKNELGKKFISLKISRGMTKRRKQYKKKVNENQRAWQYPPLSGKIKMILSKRVVRSLLKSRLHTQGLQQSKKNLPSAPSEEFIASTIVSGTIEKLVL